MAGDGSIQPKSRVATHHVLADLFGVSASRLNDSQFLAEKLGRAFPTTAAWNSTTTVHPSVSDSGNRFSLVFQSVEAHFVSHVYPDEHFVAVDMYGPTTLDIEAFFQAAVECFQPSAMRKTVIQRGMTE